MKTRRIGKTALEVTEYSFGTAPLGGLYRPCPAMSGSPHCRRPGITASAISTPPPITASARPSVMSATFCVTSRKTAMCSPPSWPPSGARAQGPDPECRLRRSAPLQAGLDYSYDGIMRSVDFSYARLGLNRIDILYVHDIGVYTHGRAVNDHYVKQLRDGGYKALDQLKSSGASRPSSRRQRSPSLLEMMADIDIDVILMAGRYSLLDRPPSRNCCRSARSAAPPSLPAACSTPAFWRQVPHPARI